MMSFQNTKAYMFALLIYEIILEPISKPIVDNKKLVFVLTLEPNFMFIYGNFLTSILATIEVVAQMIHIFSNF